MDDQMSVAAAQPDLTMKLGVSPALPRRRSAAMLIGVALALLLVATLIAGELVKPYHVVAEGLRSAIETSITLSALFSAALLRAHLNETRRMRDLLLLAALATVTLTDFAFNAVPAYAGYSGAGFALGARVAGSVLVWVAFLAAAYAPTAGRHGVTRRTASLAALAGVLIVAVGWALDQLVGPISGAGGLQSVGPVVRTAAGASCGGMLAAGLGFLRRRRHEPEVVLLAAAAFLLSGAALQRLVMPVEPAVWVTPADLLRLMAYGLVLATALRLYLLRRDQLARDAVERERKRLARDLHDGLAQDLALIAAHGDRLAQTLGREHPLAIAAARALATSRGRIVDLEASSELNTAGALRAVAAELEARFGVEITVVVEPGNSDSGGPERSELLRIAREAIVNAVRHGRARRITVTLGSGRTSMLLRITDDGQGLPLEPVRHEPGTGFGLATMRSRSLDIGGRLITRNRPEGGAEIEVVARGDEGPTRP